MLDSSFCNLECNLSGVLILVCQVMYDIDKKVFLLTCLKRRCFSYFNESINDLSKACVYQICNCLII